MGTRLDAEYGELGALFFSFSFPFLFLFHFVCLEEGNRVPFGDVSQTHKNSFKRFKHLAIICRTDDRCSHYPDRELF